jgi:hypothetical protein
VPKYDATATYKAPFAQAVFNSAAENRNSCFHERHFRCLLLPPPSRHRSADAMDLEEKIYKKKRRQQYGVNPLLCARLETGQFCTVFYELRKDKSEFFKYFRMSLKSSDELLNLLQEGNPKWPAAALFHL